MVTFNVKNFARITTEWTAAGKSHAGCLLILGIDHAQFGLILRLIDHALSTRAEQVLGPTTPLGASDQDPLYPRGRHNGPDGKKDITNI